MLVMRFYELVAFDWFKGSHDRLDRNKLHIKVDVIPRSVMIDIEPY